MNRKSLAQFLFITASAIGFSNCSKNYSPNNTTGVSTFTKDSSLLYALNITTNGFNDTSVYGNTSTINNSDYSVISKNGKNYLEFGTKFVFDNTTGSYTHPNIYAKTPTRKIENSVTMFFELMNSQNNSNTIRYSDSSDNLILSSIGIPAINSFIPPNNINNNSFNFLYEYNRKPYSWYLRTDWHNNINPCNISSWEYIEGYTSSPNSLPQINPLSITSSSKFVIVFDKNTVTNYFNNNIIAQKKSIGNITLTGCSTFYTGITLSVTRGTLLMNLKVWNRVLSLAEINNL